jgi:hypothetical protein
MCVGAERLCVGRESGPDEPCGGGSSLARPAASITICAIVEWLALGSADQTR